MNFAKLFVRARTSFVRVQAVCGYRAAKAAGPVRGDRAGDPDRSNPISEPALIRRHV